HFTLPLELGWTGRGFRRAAREVASPGADFAFAIVDQRAVCRDPSIGGWKVLVHGSGSADAKSMDPIPVLRSGDCGGRRFVLAGGVCRGVTDPAADGRGGKIWPRRLISAGADETA